MFRNFEEFYRGLTSARHDDFRAAPLAKVRDRDAFEEQRRHLLDLYKGAQVQHSFVDSSGQIFDCIPVEQQPALRKSGKPLATPPMLPKGGAETTPNAVGATFLHPERKDRYGQAMACPEGTVPVRRITLEEMSRFESLEHFLRKSPRRNRKQPSQLYVAPDAQSVADPPHEYAHAYQAVPNIGGHSFVNVWAPEVTGAQTFSLSQQWYVATGQAGLQTVEAGWQVFPQKYGHTKPVLFTYWTADGYNHTGSYSTDAGDFVQFSATCPVGIALDQISISGGPQAELELSFILSEGNWWLFVNGTDAAQAVGYYPVALYQNGPLATGATEIDFGGETVGPGSYPPMGSGAFASERYQRAAYQRNIAYFTAAGGRQDAALAPSQDWPASYTIAVQNSTDWGENFFFGGPGSTVQPLSVPSAQAANCEMGRAPEGVLGRILDAVKSSHAGTNETPPVLFPDGIVQIELTARTDAVSGGTSLDIKLLGKRTDVS